MAKSKLAILGGAFNPVHNGHLHIAQEACGTFGYGSVLFVPSMISVHKTNDASIDPYDRLGMLHAAVDELDYAVVEDCEIRRGGPSYSIETVRYVYDTYEFEGKPGLIIGDDLAPGFGTWKQVDELVQIVDLIVARRNPEEGCEIPYPYSSLRNDVETVSSSEIRSRVRDGKDIGKFVPEAVADYIADRGLYRIH